MAETAENKGQDMVLGRKTYSTKEVAELADMTQHGVRAAMHAGRLRRCNGMREKPRYSQEEVERFIAARESGRRDQRVDAEVAQELAKADALTNLVSQSQGHSEDFAGKMLAMVDHMRRGYEDQNKGLLQELERQRKRNGELEDKLIEGIEFFEKMRELEYQQRVKALDEEGSRRKLEALIKTVSPFAAAALARVIGGEQAQQQGMISFIQSLTEEQKGAMFQAIGPILKEEQAGALMILLSKWEAKETKEQAAAEAEKKEAAPDQPGAASEE